MKPKQCAVVLHNIRSAQNVGAIFRTGDAVGISKIYLTGFTPQPIDRFGRKRGDIAKAALGGELYVAWEHYPKIKTLFKKLKKTGVSLVAVEQAPHALDFAKTRIDKPSAFIFGNEVRGLNHQILKKCDMVVAIPMRGKKESLNISVAVGIILYRFL